MTIDELSPVKALRPGSIEELSELLIGEKGAVVPAGAATQMYFGNPLRRADCVDEAIVAYRLAVQSAGSDAERRLMQRRIEEISSR